MYPVKRLDGSTSYHLLDYKIGATVIQDQAVVADTADGTAGYVTDPSGTTSLLDMVGSVAGASSFNPNGGGAGTLTYSATQGDTEGLVRVFVTPDIVYRARMSGSTTAGTSLQTITNTTANTAGTTITCADSPDNDMDDGTCWCLTGANAGLSRRVTTYTANTSFVVTVPFPRTIAANDTFAIVPYSPCVIAGALNMTSNFTEADATVAWGTGGTARFVELVLNGVADSHVHFVAGDHVFNPLS